MAGLPGRVVLGERGGSAAEAGGAGPLHCLSAVVDLEFGEYVAYVVADGFGDRTSLWAIWLLGMPRARSSSTSR